MEIRIDEDGLIFMEQNKPMFYETLDQSIVEACIDTSFINRDLPIQIVSTGLKDILLPIRNSGCLSLLNPDLNVVSQISRDFNVIGIHAFSLINSHDITAICRNFAPLYGIDEEAATGTLLK